MENETINTTAETDSTAEARTDGQPQDDASSTAEPEAGTANDLASTEGELVLSDPYGQDENSEATDTVPKKKKILKRTVIALGITVLIIALIFAGLYIAVDSYLDKINKVDDNTVETIPPSAEFFETDAPIVTTAPTETVPAVADSTNAAPGTDTAETTATTTAAPQTTAAPVTEPVKPLPTINDKHLTNILLIGQDKREGQGRQRSDAMILCSINEKTKEICMISFLRDMYVMIPGGYSDNRLNASYAFGGMPLLTQTMYVNFGVTVDGCIEVDFSQFENVINAVGGVDIELSQAESELVPGTVAGKNHLNGAQALAFSRIRSIDSDFERTGRQREVLNAVITKCKKLSLSEVLNLANTLLPAMTTNMSNSEIISIITKCFPMLTSGSINSYFVPDYDCFYSAWIRDMLVLVPDLYKVRERLIEECLPLN